MGARIIQAGSARLLGLHRLADQLPLAAAPCPRGSYWRDGWWEGETPGHYWNDIYILYIYRIDIEIYRYIDI